MTLSTSAVAVCCCRDSRRSLSRRTLSIAMTACGNQRDLRVCERPNLLAVNANGADQVTFLEHRHRKYGSIASKLDAGDHVWSALDVGLPHPDVRNVRHLLREGYLAKDAVLVGTKHRLAPPILGKCWRGIVHGAET